MSGMVSIDGVRYRKEDAERRGLISTVEKPESKAKTPRNKSAVPKNK